LRPGGRWTVAQRELRASGREDLMGKKRKRVAPRPAARATMRKPTKRRRARTPPAVAFARSSLTIRFRTEDELRERLASLLALFGSQEVARSNSLERVEASESCLSLIQSVRIVAAALAPKTFNPPEKLGDTYLTSQERELFRARVVKGVTGAGCRIRDTDVPAGEGTTHSAAVGAVRENAHG
jgi:hypothetical protein